MKKSCLYNHVLIVYIYGFLTRPEGLGWVGLGRGGGTWFILRGAEEEKKKQDGIMDLTWVGKCWKHSSKKYNEVRGGLSFCLVGFVVNQISEYFKDLGRHEVCIYRRLCHRIFWMYSLPRTIYFFSYFHTL